MESKGLGSGKNSENDNDGDSRGYGDGDHERDSWPASLAGLFTSCLERLILFSNLARLFGSIADGNQRLFITVSEV